MRNTNFDKSIKAFETKLRTTKLDACTVDEILVDVEQLKVDILSDVLRSIYSEMVVSIGLIRKREEKIKETYAKRN